MKKFSCSVICSCWWANIRNSRGQRGHMPLAIPDTAFLALWFCSYMVYAAIILHTAIAICSMIGLLSLVIRGNLSYMSAKSVVMYDVQVELWSRR